MTTMLYSGVLTVIDCGECHVVFAIDSGWNDDLQRTGNLFYCPNGHHIGYGKTENQRLKRELEQKEQALARANARATAAYDQAQAAHRSARAYRGQVTKLKKRVANGVCPCCNRHFADLHRHMSNRHPDFVEKPE